VRGSTSPVTALPFTVSATAVMAVLLEVVFRHRGNRRRIKIASILPPGANCNKSTLNLQRTAGQGRVPAAAPHEAVRCRPGSQEVLADQRRHSVGRRAWTRLWLHFIARCPASGRHTFVISIVTPPRRT
jgi:hypothetical protein